MSPEEAKEWGHVDEIVSSREAVEEAERPERLGIGRKGIPRR